MKKITKWDDSLVGSGVDCRIYGGKFDIIGGIMNRFYKKDKNKMDNPYVLIHHKEIEKIIKDIWKFWGYQLDLVRKKK